MSNAKLSYFKNFKSKEFLLEAQKIGKEICEDSGIKITTAADIHIIGLSEIIFDLQKRVEKLEQQVESLGLNPIYKDGY